MGGTAQPDNRIQTGYDPFARGPHAVGVKTVPARDAARNRQFPVEIWYPAAPEYAGKDLAAATQDAFPVPGQATTRRQAAVRDAAAQTGTFPLVAYSHPSGYHRRAATYLCTHLASHGYVVGALDHSEVVAAELAPQPGETAEQRKQRAEAWIASRVPDARFLLDCLLEIGAGDAGGVGMVGHSFGGWTALALTEVDQRIGAVVALAPAGNSQPRPGILPVKLNFEWGRDVPTLYMAAEFDTPTPPSGICELFERTRGTKQMVTLQRADHAHFMDDTEVEHERVRAMPFAGELAWIPREMRPIGELCPGAEAHLAVRALTLAHLDAHLKQREAARRLLAGDLEAELARRGTAVVVHRT